MTTRESSKRTRIPVRTGRDSSRDAARLTRAIVSRNAARSTENPSPSSTSGSRGKSSGLYVWSVYDELPDVTRAKHDSRQDLNRRPGRDPAADDPELGGKLLLRAADPHGCAGNGI